MKQASRILVIDDDDGVRMLLRRILEQEGYEVEEARNGAIGVRSFRASPVDLVITDIIMPDKEGISTILELREVSEEIKIIAISGGGRISSADHLRTAEDLGVFCTFKKPFDRKELLGAISEALAAS
ncbi:MAG: response regulator [Planctomycetota bacterium]